MIEYEDVFGNWATRFEIHEPYTELTIAAETVVELLDVDPFAFANLPIRPPSFPLVWMPWEQKMLQPYLTPEELPDTQLQELYGYGMEFVKLDESLEFRRQELCTWTFDGAFALRPSHDL